MKMTIQVKGDNVHGEGREVNGHFTPTSYFVVYDIYIFQRDEPRYDKVCCFFAPVRVRVYQLSLSSRS